MTGVSFMILVMFLSHYYNIILYVLAERWDGGHGGGDFNLKNLVYVCLLVYYNYTALDQLKAYK